mgnify:CR=1 FL=1
MVGGKREGATKGVQKIVRARGKGEGEIEGVQKIVRGCIYSREVDVVHAYPVLMRGPRQLDLV